jgi:hypothetical protein
MKRGLPVVLVFVLLLGLSSQAFGAVKIGSSCSKVSSFQLSGKTLLVCDLIKKTKVWRKASNIEVRLYNQEKIRLAKAAEDKAAADKAAAEKAAAEKAAADAKRVQTKTYFTIRGSRTVNCTNEQLGSRRESAKIIVPTSGGQSAAKYVYYPGRLELGEYGASVTAGKREYWSINGLFTPFQYRYSETWYADVEVICSYLK